jgi:hypothetical protein
MISIGSTWIGSHVRSPGKVLGQTPPIDSTPLFSGLRPQATNKCVARRCSISALSIDGVYYALTQNTQLTCSHVQLGFKLIVEVGGICLLHMLLQHRADKVLTQMRHHDWGGAPYAPRGSLDLECMRFALQRGSLRRVWWRRHRGYNLCGGGEASRADIIAASPSSFCWLTMSGMSCMRDRSAIVRVRRIVFLSESPMTPAIAGRAPFLGPSARDEPSVSEE